MTRIAGTSFFLGLAALAATVGCTAGASGSATPASTPVSAPTQSAAAPQPNGSPVVVSCEPNQRTLVRPVVVNGATLSQIECVSSAGTVVAAPAQPFAAPIYA